MEISEINDLKFIRTGDGRFYAGMTQSNTEKKKTVKRPLGKSFSDIDLDKNGRLSIDEIIKRRKKEVKNEYTVAALVGGLGLCDVLFDINSPMIKLIWFALDVAIVIASLLNAENLKEGNKDFEEIAKLLKEKGKMDLLV